MRARRLRTLIATVVGIGAIAAAGTWWFDRSATGVRDTGMSPGSAIDGGVSPIADDRRTYKHSVVPGGVWDSTELARTVAADPVVAEHYRGVEPATIRAETLVRDQLAFVSYRVGDRVYWTKRKVRISAGETLLTNGDTTIRARCGNCISLEPMLPTSDDEPDPAELDALMDADQVLTSRNLNHSMGGTLVDAGGSGDIDPAGDPTAGLILYPLAGESAEGTISDPSYVIVAPQDPFSFDDLGGKEAVNALLPTPFVDPSTGPFGPPSSTVPFNPPLSDFLDPDEGDPGPEQFSAPVTSPVALTPVPEPGTFVLVGSAIAGLLARRWRARKHP